MSNVIGSNIIDFPATQITASVLRQRLMVARERVLVPTFGRVPRERGLLRRRMIDELVHHRPATRPEFFRCIPPDVIRNTDPVQFGEALDFVLGVIWGDPRCC